MKTGTILGAALLLVTAIAPTAADAGCRRGYENLPGSLGPGQRDNTRFFTVYGGARVGIEVQEGGPISMNLGCGWRTGYSHYCNRSGSGRKYARLRNTSGRQITYRWICAY